MLFKQIYEEKLSQYAYLVGCQETNEAFIIDPLRDIDQYFDLAGRLGMKITGAADTHIHADFLSGLREFAERGTMVYVSGEGGNDWRYEWVINSNYRKKVLKDGDVIRIGNIRIQAVHTPGHTPEHMSYVITDGKVTGEPLGIASGDFVFVGDVGRPDLLETAAGQKGAMRPSAQRMYRSLNWFRTLPGYLQVWPGHGAGSACGKALGAIPVSTVGYEMRYNEAIKAAETERGFIDFILDGQPEPPLYFARMKRDNRQGPSILHGLPDPEPVTGADLDHWLDRNRPVVIDARPVDDFVKGHIPQSLCIPFDKQFNTVAGSYIDQGDPLLLVIDRQNVKEAVRDLVRVGLDRVIGYLALTEFECYSHNHELSAMVMQSFDNIGSYIKDERSLIVDVRKATEYMEGHVDGAVQIAHIRLPEHTDLLPRNKTLLVHCAAGSRAASASSYLKNKGYSVVYINDLFENCPMKTREKNT